MLWEGGAYLFAKDCIDNTQYAVQDNVATESRREFFVVPKHGRDRTCSMKERSSELEWSKRG